MLLLSLLACTQPPPPTTSWCEAHGQALGTTWTLKWAAPDCRPEVHARGQAVLDEVNQHMSTYREDSDLSIARRANGPVPVATETALVVRDALALAEATGGAFDPTVEPLMEVWGFHSASRHIDRPTPEALRRALEQVGWSKVSLDYNESGPLLNTGGTALDLSSIAKGYAVDRVSIALSRLGYGNHLVEVGGEVRVSGIGPSGLWSLGVDVPEQGVAPGTELAAVVSLTNSALATSGNYRNLVDVGGQQVHHTMDPRTGAPAITDVASVSVVAPDCRTADALATATMVLGAQAGLRFLESQPDTEGLILTQGPTGFVQHATSGMGALLKRGN